MKSLSMFDHISYNCSKDVARKYSTSFFSSIRLLSPEIREPIYAIYGMVRFADEIVDTFHEHNKPALLAKFKTDTFQAIEQGISLNPVLHSFQQTVLKYKIDVTLVEAFFESMETDLIKQEYRDANEFRQYIYGSAEVVGLMCLHIFCDGDKTLFNSLKPSAQALGAAFQKVNFLRDLGSDMRDLQRKYFPGFTVDNFNRDLKQKIEEEITEDFKLAYQGIQDLPLKARFGVFVAYKYYFALFGKLKKLNAEVILNRRVRIPNHIKFLIFVKAGLRSRLNMI
jgi:15-cis-phytoene synthase